MGASRARLTTFEIDAILRRISRPRLGLITAAAAAEAGVDHRAIARRCAAGALVPVFAEVMRLAEHPESDEQYVLAAALAVPGSEIGATSAAVVHEFPVGSLGAALPVVTVPPGRSPRTRGVRVVRTSHPLPSMRWRTVRVATPAATVVQLPRFVVPARVERCLDHALAHRLTTVDSVRLLIDAAPPQSITGRRLLLDLLDARSGGIGHRSRLEQIVSRWLDEAGLGGWVSNHRVPVGGGRTVEVDFAWPDRRVALEVSPFFTHGSRAGQERDARRREQLVVSGWRVVEATDPAVASQAAFDGIVAALSALLRRPPPFVRAGALRAGVSAHEPGRRVGEVA